VAAQIPKALLRAGIGLELDPLPVGMMRGERALDTAAVYARHLKKDRADREDVRGLGVG
jgi:hypothetical protein